MKLVPSALPFESRTSVVFISTKRNGFCWLIGVSTLNGFMAIPNLVALLGLSGVVIKLTKDFFAKK